MKTATIAEGDERACATARAAARRLDGHLTENHGPLPWVAPIVRRRRKGTAGARRGSGMPDEPGGHRAVVPPPGFEPGTCRVETGCSIQLSYGGVPPGYAPPRTGLRTPSAVLTFGGDPHPLPYAAHPHGGCSSARLERQVVALEAGGSSPLSHPMDDGGHPLRRVAAVARIASAVVDCTTRAPLAQWQSNGLLIRRFWVRIPGGVLEQHQQGPDSGPGLAAFRAGPVRPRSAGEGGDHDRRLGR